MWKSERGFFLLETLLIAFLLMTAASFFSLYQHTEAIQAYREEKVVAEFFALREMALAESSLADGQQIPAADDCVENNVQFTARTSISDTEREDCKKIHVMVFWESHKNSWQIGLVKFVNQRG